MLLQNNEIDFVKLYTGRLVTDESNSKVKTQNSKVKNVN